MLKMTGAVGAVCALVSGVAAAGPYVGGTGILSERSSYENIDRATGFSAFGGYRFDGLPLVLELAYLDAGDADITDLGVPGLALGYKGFSATVGWYGALSPNGSGFWLRGGYYTGDASFSTEFDLDVDGEFLPAGTYEQSSNGFTVGLGGDWMLTHWFGLRFGIDGFLGMKDFQDDENMTTYSLGVVLHLPTAGAAAPAPVFHAAEPTPYMPPVAPLVPPATIVEQPALASEPSVAPQAAISGLALLGVDAAVRAQPRMQAQSEAVLPAKLAVAARNRISNAEGRWWFVEHEKVRGWVQESSFDVTTLPR